MSIVPIYEGFSLSHAVVNYDFGGNDITNYLVQLIRNNSDPFFKNKGIAKDIKEKLCYMALDPEKELMLAKKVVGLEKTYETGDGTKILVGIERFLAPECLFNPSMAMREIDPLDDIIVESARNCDSDLRRDLFSNIVLAGGSTLFPGLKERLGKEIKEQIPESYEVKIIAAPERNILTWTGGKILASLKTFDKMWLTMREYREKGVQSIHRCF